MSTTGPLAVAPYTATGTTSDSFGDTGQWTFTLNVTPGTDLSIATIADVTTTGTAAMVPVSFTAPTASDDGASVPVTCDHVSGSMFPIGTTKVTCSASDSDDTPSTVSSSFNVEVSAADLSIATIADVNATGTAAMVAVNFIAPTASDEDGSVSVTCDHASGIDVPDRHDQGDLQRQRLRRHALDGLVELQRRGLDADLSIATIADVNAPGTPPWWR